MQAVLLAAGFGSRLRPITNSQPKCMVPINGQPLLDIWLQQLTHSASISDIFVNTHYFSGVVAAFLNDKWAAFPQVKNWYEPELLGTAGTLKHNASQLLSEDVVVIHADNLSVFDLDAFIQAHQQRPDGCEMTMMVFETDTPSSCGIVELQGKTVVAMHEKVANPPGNLANGAVYIMSQKVLRWIVEHDAEDISTQVIPAMLGKIQAWTNHTYHRDIGTPESYTQGQQEYTAIVRHD